VIKQKRVKGNDYEFLLDSRPASLLDIAKASSDDKLWKSFLERHRLEHSHAGDDFLQYKLGDFLNTHKIIELTGIKYSTLTKWRKLGLVKAEKLKGREWHYSIQSIVNMIKNADIKDLR
jgi:hypothetical protein